uniref:Uncharacterized protein n=1 Tax=Romanomermis culicivorax TaxID=13658 RepID=A0A915KCF9_ROMCU
MSKNQEVRKEADEVANKARQRSIYVPMDIFTPTTMKSVLPSVVGWVALTAAGVVAAAETTCCCSDFDFRNVPRLLGVAVGGGGLEQRSDQSGQTIASIEFPMVKNLFLQKFTLKVVLLNQ